MSSVPVSDPRSNHSNVSAAAAHAQARDTARADEAKVALKQGALSFGDFAGAPRLPGAPLALRASEGDGIHRIPTSPLRRRRSAVIIEPEIARPMAELARKLDESHAAVRQVISRFAQIKPSDSSPEGREATRRDREELKAALETLKLVRAMQDATLLKEAKAWATSLGGTERSCARADLAMRLAVVDAERADIELRIATADAEIAAARQPRNLTFEAAEEARMEGARLELSKVNLVWTREALDAEGKNIRARIDCLDAAAATHSRTTEAKIDE